jgi:RAD51-like protein 1
MSHRRLERLGLDPIVLEALLRNDISTVQELLQTSPFTLMVITNSSLKGVETIIEHVSTRIAPKPSSVLSILRDREVKTRYLSTGLGALDNSMKGGLLVGCISEICGTPGIGKSQFCLSTALQAVMSSMPGIGETVSTRMEEAPTHQDRMSGVIYIDTELKFDAQRLIQMAKNKFPEVFTEEYRLDAAHRVDELLQSVEVYRPVSCKELLALVDDIQAVVITKNVKLVRVVAKLRHKYCIYICPPF